MINLEGEYFEWLLSCIDSDGVSEGFEHICGLLHSCDFHRRVGNDINRAIDGANLRKEFLSQFEDVDFDLDAMNKFMSYECSWLEMLIALARSLDYLYEGGVDGRLAEMINNMKLGHLASFKSRRSKAMQDFDQRIVDTTTSNIDQNRFTSDGHGGIFPLRKKSVIDQREVEIWDQHSAYFRERF